MASAKMPLFFLLLLLLADVWASHPQAPTGGGSVALLENYHRMENSDIPLDVNTKIAMRFTIELGCRDYAQTHSIERYESGAIISRVYFSSLECALQRFFPGCRIAYLKENPQKHASITSTTLPYIVTTVGKYGTGFYTKVLSPTLWIRFNPSQPKASAHLREFVVRNSKCFDILYLQGIQRDLLEKVLSLPGPVAKVVVDNDTSISKAVFGRSLRTLFKVPSRLLLQSSAKRRFTTDCRAISPSLSFTGMSFRRTSAMLQRLQSLRSISRVIY